MGLLCACVSVCVLMRRVRDIRVRLCMVLHLCGWAHSDMSQATSQPHKSMSLGGGILMWKWEQWFLLLNVDKKQSPLNSRPKMMAQLLMHLPSHCVACEGVCGWECACMQAATCTCPLLSVLSCVLSEFVFVCLFTRLLPPNLALAKLLWLIFRCADVAYWCLETVSLCVCVCLYVWLPVCMKEEETRKMRNKRGGEAQRKWSVVFHLFKMQFITSSLTKKHSTVSLVKFMLSHVQYFISPSEIETTEKTMCNYRHLCENILVSVNLSNE